MYKRQVDLAEDDDKKAKVHAINADGTQNIADACKKIDAKMVYISTDYVFDGQGTTPWQPDCKDYAPLNVLIFYLWPADFSHYTCSLPPDVYKRQCAGFAE